MTQIDQEQFKWVGKAASNEDTRYALSSVCYEGNTIVATDGRRMHVSRITSAALFPRWQDVLPPDPNCTAVFDSESLHAVAKSICATVKNVDKMPGAVCQLKITGERAELRLIEPDTVKMSWVVDVEHSDTDGKLLFNPTFLRDALDRSDGKCTVSAKIEGDGYCKTPIRVDRSDEMFAVFMPVSKKASLEFDQEPKHETD